LILEMKKPGRSLSDRALDGAAAPDFKNPKAQER